MKITLFAISTDRTKINLTITDAATVSSLKFWTDSTYKDYTKAIDLTSKLTASATENIELSLADLGLCYFDGVYFVEAEDPDEVSEAVTADLTRYEECILDKILNTIGCADCLQFQSQSIINAQTLLYSLQTAVNNSFIDEIVLIVTALNLYCSNQCKTCTEFKTIADNTYYNTTT